MIEKQRGGRGGGGFMGLAWHCQKDNRLLSYLSFHYYNVLFFLS